MFEATIQVLLSQGPSKLTTTKIADRAGVSVGTLYQYFGDKQSLISSVLEKHLVEVTEFVEAACDENRHKTLEVMTTNLIKAFFNAKFSHPEASKALYAVASEVEGGQMVTTLMQRSQASICGLLSSASDAHFEDPITATFTVSTAMVGPVQALLAIDAPQQYQDKICSHLCKMSYSYLREIST
ncbi:hypothetical protein A9Q99_01020 [Gammaproteobacteria bacterium 45_16_T64]|nr:hypothetical protein A9Q99_01020 [Gammaproteobacteria bacterium 45_16_T64]